MVQFVYKRNVTHVKIIQSEKFGSFSNISLSVWNKGIMKYLLGTKGIMKYLLVYV